MGRNQMVAECHSDGRNWGKTSETKWEIRHWQKSQNLLRRATHVHWSLLNRRELWSFSLSARKGNPTYASAPMQTLAPRLSHALRQLHLYCAQFHTRFLMWWLMYSYVAWAITRIPWRIPNPIVGLFVLLIWLHSSWQWTLEFLKLL